MKTDYIFSNEDWFKNTVKRLGSLKGDIYIEYLYNSISSIFCEENDLTIAVRKQKEEQDRIISLKSDLYHLAMTAREHFINLEKWISDHKEFSEEQFKMLFKVPEPDPSKIEDTLYPEIMATYPLIKQCLSDIAASSQVLNEELKRKKEFDNLKNACDGMKQFYDAFKEGVGLIICLKDSPKKYHRLITKLTRQEFGKCIEVGALINGFWNSRYANSDKNADDFLGQLTSDLSVAGSLHTAFKEFEKRFKSDIQYDLLKDKFFEKMSTKKEAIKGCSERTKFNQDRALKFCR